jgi:uncharacterized protein YjdB
VTDQLIANPVATVAVNPNAVTLLVGQQQPVQAVVTDVDGKPVGSAAIVWSVRDVGIASVSQTGVVTAVAVGETEIAANVNGKSGIATITVQRPPVASVSVLPSHVDAFVGARSTLTAVAYDAQGNQLSSRTFVWTSTNAGVATVDAGIVTAVAPGSATIMATTGGKSDTATITVTLTPVASITVTPGVLSMFPAETMQFTATPRDAAGNVLTGRSVQWSSSNTSVARVSAADGTVTAVTDGITTITAAIGTVVGRATVTVSSAPIASVTVQPATASIVQNASQQLSAVVLDVNNQVLVRIITWTSSNPAVATVTSNGLVAGLIPGTVTITATTSNKSGSGAVTVLRAPVASVALLPTTASIRVGSTFSITATPNDASGRPLPGRVVTWSSSNPQVATVTAAGAVTGVAAGRATITATCEGINSTATVDVGVPVGTVSLSPATATVRVGLTQALVATVKDANGTVTTDRPITWVSSAPAVATVSTTGVVTGVTAGSATITATAEGKSGTAAITVTVPPVATVTVQPPTATLVLGTTTTLSAITKDDLGNVVIGRLVTWSVDDPSIATVTSTGVVTAKAVGTTTVSATSEGKTGAAIVTVTPVPVATVTVQPSTTTVAVGGTVTLIAFPRDASGNVLTGRVVTWTSSKTVFATVDSAGVVTGVKSGTTTITATCEGKTGTSTVTVP